MVTSSEEGLAALKDDAWRLERGSGAELGAHWHWNGHGHGRDAHFAVYAANADAMTLGLFAPQTQQLLRAYTLNPEHHRTGDVWHAAVTGLEHDVGYAFAPGHVSLDSVSDFKADAPQWLLDPYARALCGREQWGVRGQRPMQMRRGLLRHQRFDWGTEAAPSIPWHDTVIYELHVRGFTRACTSVSAEVAGTYSGLAASIPYLQRLGVTAVELLPVFEFEEDAGRRQQPKTGMSLLNYWGYDPLNYFVPKAGYAATLEPGAAIDEFKAMVRSLHSAGIEVILDVVYNHTGEGPIDGPVVSFRGLAPDDYYHVDADGAYGDYSGCGNTLNCNAPIVCDLIVASLRHWVTEFHVDGFRFNLASALTRGTDGEPEQQPLLIERILADPVLGDIKLIAEPWDAVGLHQTGRFPGNGRFSEWHDGFRDTVRRFLRGEGNMVKPLASVLAGSEQRFARANAAPRNAVNFITAHDGFTLRDLVSYSAKRNLDNGEQDRDGIDENLSWNCGVEGPSHDPE